MTERTDMEPIIKFEGVSRKYGSGESEVYALKDVDLSIERGKYVVILGQSGAGKSTVLNLIGGIDRPTSGRIVVDGTDITALSEKALSGYRADKIGYVFQFYNLLTGLTAIENIAITKEISPGAIDPEKMLEAVGLSSRADRFPSQLSGGEQQRVSIARALAKNPEVILADEPTGALDSETGRSVMDLIIKTCREGNKTLIIVTHNEEIAKAADTTIRMKDGRIIEIEDRAGDASVKGDDTLC